MAKHLDYLTTDIFFLAIFSYFELLANCKLLGIDIYDIDDNTFEVMSQLKFDIEGIGINHEDML